jgi:hypothetical protein
MIKDESIGSLIDRLAGQTGAPGSFVQRIRDLFSNKGIALASDCAPYLTALEQAFRREQSIRLSALQTRQNLERLQRQLQQFNEVCRRQITRMEGMGASFGRQPGGTVPDDEDVETAEVQVVEIREPAGIQVTRTRTLLVPGPKEDQ